MKKKMLKKSEVLREGYIKGLKAGKEVVSKMLKESYNGQLKVICDLDHYKPWSGAVDTWNKIQDADMAENLKHDDSDEVLVSSDEEEEGLPTDTNIAVDPEELANCKNDDDVNELVMDSVINKYGRDMRGCEKIRFIKENKFAVRGIHWVR